MTTGQNKLNDSTQSLKGLGFFLPRVEKDGRGGCRGKVGYTCSMLRLISTIRKDDSEISNPEDLNVKAKQEDLKITNEKEPWARKENEEVRSRPHSRDENKLNRPEEDTYEVKPGLVLEPHNALKVSPTKLSYYEAPLSSMLAHRGRSIQAVDLEIGLSIVVLSVNRTKELPKCQQVRRILYKRDRMCLTTSEEGKNVPQPKVSPIASAIPSTVDPGTCFSANEPFVRVQGH